MEEVARLDGSTGWCLFIATSSSITGAFLADLAAEEMFGRDPLTVMGGSIAGVGKAVVQENGYLVSGRWPYASGSQHCAWLLALCQVLDGDLDDFMQAYLRLKTEKTHKAAAKAGK